MGIRQIKFQIGRDMDGDIEQAKMLP